MSVLVSLHENLDSNLHICDYSADDIPVAGDAGGLWYCGTQTQSCNETESPPFGIEPGFFADFRNFSSLLIAGIVSTTSTAATTSATSKAKISTSSVTTDATAAAITTPRTPDPSYPSQTDTEQIFLGGDTAAILLGAICVVLLALDIYMLFFRRRSGGNPEAIQKPMQAEHNSKESGELDGRLNMGALIPELPASRYSRVEPE